MLTRVWPGGLGGARTAFNIPEHILIYELVKWSGRHLLQHTYNTTQRGPVLPQQRVAQPNSLHTLLLLASL